MTSPFPPEFLWGAATAAYQIEGSPLADGAGAAPWACAGVAPTTTTADIASNTFRMRLPHVTAASLTRFA